MPTNKLTDAKCKAAKPGNKDRKEFDGGGLFLWISPKGGKTWRMAMAYRFEGKPKTVTFGPYTEISLAQAREKREEVKTKLREDIDPIESRKKDDSDALKFKEASDKYWEGRKDLSESYLKNATSALETHLFPQLGDKPITNITRETLMEPLNVMNANGKYVYVRKVRM